ncbi:tyrosine-type recombinase/integrase [Litorivivens sp.]|uniref:tyrosine-type recombinase/integrase n=1 Tax=Litorivivens sp. TaxID=2020868 RepID=UPI003561F079
MKLTATGVKQAKPREKPFKLSDGGGLFLLVNPAGSKYWRYKYRYLGKEKTLALGVFPEVSLKHARQKHQEAREKLANGIDPAELRKVEKLTRTFSASNTFESVGREWFAVRMGGKSKSHYDRTLRILEKDLFPKLGSRPLESIKAPEVLVVLRDIQERGATDTAHRARSVASQVFCFAEAAGLVDHDPTRALRNALKPHEKKHYAAITDPAEVRRLLLAMDVELHPKLTH